LAIDVPLLLNMLAVRVTLPVPVWVAKAIVAICPLPENVEVLTMPILMLDP